MKIGNAAQSKQRPVFAALLMLSVTMLAASQAFAQVPAQQPYPWQRRAAECLDAAKAHERRCMPEENWPTFELTIQRVASLYSGDQFALLERALQDVVSSKKRFDDGDSPAASAYWTFRRLMPAPGTNARHKDQIAKWRTAVPSSYFVPLAEARFTYASAWNVRGSGQGGSVSKESWELFNLRLREAEQILLDAPAALKDTPLWHNLMLAIALDASQTTHTPDEVLEEAARRWPDYYDFYEVRLTRLVPKWGGSWRQVESFIGRWSDELSSSEGHSLYARLYVSLKDQGVTPDQTAMDWAKMRRSFEDLTKRYPHARFKNLYASYACFARDKPAFSAATAKLSARELAPDFWLSGHSYEACMRWAGI
jgi:hypothetical protein